MVLCKILLLESIFQIFKNNDLTEVATMKPILFNTQMVKAILDGKKTVTRRCIKLPSYVKQQENGLYTLYADGTCYENQYLEDIRKYLKQPYKVGDVLYVRETWKRWRTSKNYSYKEDWERDGIADIPKWKPSIHMPKEAARIFLKVTNVRMERLQDITDVDAEKEGASPDNPLNFSPDKWPNIENFKSIWDSTIKKSDIGTYGWDANPWVWVIEFERCDKSIE